MEIFSLGKQVESKSYVGAKFALVGFEGEGTQRYFSKGCTLYSSSDPECCFSSFFPGKAENIFHAQYAARTSPKTLSYFLFMFLGYSMKVC
jgi:hypothetical protein